jgi:hypothetical protein
MTESISTPPSFEVILQHAKRGVIEGESLLALDPGETTGWAHFESGKFVRCGQIPIKEQNFQQAITEMQLLLAFIKPTLIIIEDYRVYKWKAEDHINSSLWTPRLIGGIETLAFLARPSIPVIKRLAQQAKQFCTDDKLKQWDLWQRGERHARDAIRHGCFHLLFGDHPI